jgi:transcriptional regulator with XRE-family HTH domain
MEKLQSYLKHLRERAELSQIALSKKAGYSETYCGKVEANERRLSAKALMRFLDALDCSQEDKHYAARLFALQKFPLEFVDLLAMPPLTRAKRKRGKAQP